MEPHISFFPVEIDEQAQFRDANIHEIDQPTKLHLLRDEATARSNSVTNGLDILAKLRALNSSIGEEFRLKETGLEKFKMRLYQEGQRPPSKPVTSYVAGGNFGC